jgi:hypothetical protein
VSRRALVIQKGVTSRNCQVQNRKKIMSISTVDNVPNVIVTTTNQARPTPVTPAKITVKSEDLDVLRNWVKKELFEKVKFLYDTDGELRVNGALYCHFVRNCKERLIGLRVPEAVGEYRRLYVELLWQEANRKRRNLISGGLTMRRSSVYSGMQNQFVGEFCMSIILIENKFLQLTNVH